MSKDEESFLQRLWVTFQVEADEHLKAMSALLRTLEKPAAAEQAPYLIETLFREAHSLKGAARAVNRADIEAVCQALESVLADLKRRNSGLSAAFFDVLYRTVDTLAHLLAAGFDGKSESDAAQIGATTRALQSLHGSVPVAASPPQEVRLSDQAAKPSTIEAAGAAETVRISTATLERLLIQVEELLAFKSSAAHLAGELGALRVTLSERNKEWVKTVRDARTIRRSAEKHVNGAAAGRKSLMLDRLLDTVEGDEFFVKSLRDRLAQLERQAEQERRSLTGMVDSLLEDMKQALMLPFGSLFELFPKLVRDLARESGKEVELLIDGAAIDIDRRIMEQMKAPLIHLLRNAVDHGIETPAERAGKNKLPRGRITIETASKEGNKVELVIADDGGGIDLEKVKAGAVRLDIVSHDALQDLSRSDTLDLVFESGVSTSPILTDVSGRGLGLAIVREKVEKLGGSIALELPEEGGTRFRIVLPTTLATFRGLLVAIGERQFVLPSRNVERVTRIPRTSIKTVENRETIELDGFAVSLVRLADVLGLSDGAAAPQNTDYLQVAVLTGTGKRIAFAVSAVLADQEVLVKGLGPQLARVPNIAGATVLGAGRVVPILSVPDLLKSALKASPSPAVKVAQREVRQQSLLVVEDSITSRSLLKNILEAAGYQVAVAVDGIDALTTLRTGQFDLVVSDVEMPRMDGFDLTAKIRADKKLAELPVVLVTALESREHKERGIDAGADAYIVKSSFDQSNLLEVIRRLI